MGLTFKPLFLAYSRTYVISFVAKPLPPMACLASRIPYGSLITKGRLERIAKAEEVIKKIANVKLVRVRDHGMIARIEVGRNERRKFYDKKIMDAVAQELMKLGYEYVVLDLRGYKSGSLDELLNKEHVIRFK